MRPRRFWIIRLGWRRNSMEFKLKVSYDPRGKILEKFACLIYN